MNKFKVGFTILVGCSVWSCSFAQEQAANLTPAQDVVRLMTDKHASQHCKQHFIDMNNIAGANEPSTGIVTFFRNDQQSGLVSSVLGVSNSNGTSINVVDMSQDENCSITNEITKVWVDACAAVMTNAFPAFAKTSALSASVAIYSSNNISVFASGLNVDPAKPEIESGCLTIQKETVYFTSTENAKPVAQPVAQPKLAAAPAIPAPVIAITPSEPKPTWKIRKKR